MTIALNELSTGVAALCRWAGGDEAAGAEVGRCARAFVAITLAASLFTDTAHALIVQKLPTRFAR